MTTRPTAKVCVQVLAIVFSLHFVASNSAEMASTAD
jgi:hypothetical protein